MATPLYDQCRAESRLAAPARDGGAATLSLRRRQASRLLGAEADRPGPGRAACAAIQQALRTRALADQCWELHELSDDPTFRTEALILVNFYR
jgi:hypothetical protein